MQTNGKSIISVWHNNLNIRLIGEPLTPEDDQKLHELLDKMFPYRKDKTAPNKDVIYVF